MRTGSRVVQRGGPVRLPRARSSGLLAGLVVLVVAASCGRDHDDADETRRLRPAQVANEAALLAEQNPQSRVTLGMTEEEVLAQLGAPTFRELIRDGVVVLTYYSAAILQARPRDFELVGLTVVLDAGRVVACKPINMSSFVDQPNAGVIPAPATTGAHSTHGSAALKFFLVRDGAFEGSLFFSTPEFPALGHIAGQPDFRIERLDSVETGERLTSQQSSLVKRPTVILGLPEPDAVRFARFAQANAYNRVLVMMDDVPLATAELVPELGEDIWRHIALPLGPDRDVADLTRRLQGLVEAVLPECDLNVQDR
jgi:hypothetical protein